MMKKIQLCLLICATVLSTGCPKYGPKVNFNRNGFVKQINDHFTAKQTEYFNFLKDNKPDEAKLKRNELIEDALPYIDEAYMDFITGLQAGRDRGNFLADVVELGAAATISSLKGTQRSIQLVGVALTAFKGGRRSADLNFYKEQSTPVLITKMDGNRAKVRATILTRERTSTADYPIGAAIADIVDYYNAGTLVRAFTELQKDTAIQTKASEDKVLDLKISPFLTDSQISALRSISDAREDLRAKLSSPDQPTVQAATTRIKAILGKLYKPEEVAAATTPEALFKMLQDKIAEATRNRDQELLAKIQALLNSP